MTRAWRVVPLLLALLLGACGDDSGSTVRAVPHAVTTLTTVTAPPVPPTTQPAARVVVRKASRGAVAPRVAPAPEPAPREPAPVAAANSEVPPECHVRGAKSRAFSDACWRPFVARYPWPVDRMLGILYCESKGDEWAVNGKHNSLLQIANSNTLGDGPGNIAHGYGVYQSAARRGRGTAPWAQCGG